MAETFELELNAVFEPSEAFELELDVPGVGLTFRLYLNVPEAERLGGFVLDVPYA